MHAHIRELMQARAIRALTGLVFDRHDRHLAYAMGALAAGTTGGLSGVSQYSLSLLFLCSANTSRHSNSHCRIARRLPEAH